MNSRFTTICAWVLLGASIVVCSPRNAYALSLSGTPLSISQVAFTATVRHGHVVSASTSMNRLIAGGSFVAGCVSTYTGTIEGERTLTSANFGFNQLAVTIPAQLPAQSDMPGFDNVPGGTTLSCSYRWTARAEESTYSVNAYGIGITIGGERASESRSVPFEMYKPGDDQEHDTGCIR